MGIRVKKDIGYLLDIKDFSKILVGNYSEILENLDYEDEVVEQFWNSFKKQMSSPNQEQINQILNKLALKQYSVLRKDKKITPLTLLDQAYFGDEIIGMLLRTSSHIKYSRYDDLIDYYENPLEDNIQYIKKPIYPMDQYIYKGGLDHQENTLEQYKTYSSSECRHSAGLVNPDWNDDVLSSGAFHPQIEREIYFMMKAANILKEDVSEMDLYFHLEPVILTYWS